MNMLNCPAPYGHLNLDVTSKARACCFYRPIDVDRDIDEFESFEQMFKWYNQYLSNDAVMEQTCKRCIDYKKLNIESQLDILNNNWMKDAKLENKLVSVEVALDSVCNMACAMCSSTHSSKWTSLKKTNIFFDDLFSNRVSDKDHYSKIEKLFLNSDLSNLQFVRFLGGEPLYGKNFEKFLDILIAKSNPENIQIEMATNCSVFPSQQLLDKILKFKRFSCNLSIDGVEEVAELQRYGTKWNKVKDNIDSYCTVKKEFPDKVMFGISPTYTILSMEHHKRLYDFWKQRREYLIFAPTIAHNRELTIETLDSKFRSKFDHTWKVYYKNYIWPKNFFESWPQLQDVDYNFIFTYLDNYAKITKMDIKSIIPKTYKQLELQSNV